MHFCRCTINFNVIKQLSKTTFQYFYSYRQYKSDSIQMENKFSCIYIVLHCECHLQLNFQDATLAN